MFESFELTLNIFYNTLFILFESMSINILDGSTFYDKRASSYNYFKQNLDHPFFLTGSQGSVSNNNMIQMRKSHGIVAILGWGLILPIGAIIARYFRHKDPLWFYLHSVIQLIGFVFGLATVLLGLQLYSKMHVHIPAHRGIGIFILVLSILQVFNSHMSFHTHIENLLVLYQFSSQ